MVGIASSALFDLSECDSIFQTCGPAEYREFQLAYIDNYLNPGVAFPFIQRILALNELAPSPSDPLVEVIILSRNSPETGMRVMRSIKNWGLDISRAAFTEGQSPFPYMNALKMSLFLSANESDVRAAVDQGLPAGYVLPTDATNDPMDTALRIAFDFDGVLASDESERVFQADQLKGFIQHELDHLSVPHEPGPLVELLRHVNRIQRIEEARLDIDPAYEKRLSVSIVTSRNAPAHERAMFSLQNWGVYADNAFFLGGVDKGPVLRVLKPHIFFDDQIEHANSAADVVPSVHIPFGMINAPKDLSIEGSV